MTDYQPTDGAWHSARQDDLPQAISEFKASLPGWYYSLCECQISCDATIAPTTDSPHIDLAVAGNNFDEGFRVDLPQPSSLAEALRFVQAQAIAAIAEAQL